MKRIILSSVAFSALLLMGCGGSSSSGGSTGGSSGSVSGTVSGSYYEGAIVCFDTDGDGSCTGEASSTTSDVNGDYTLSGDGSYPIIAEIPVGAKKHTVLGDTGVDINASTKTVFAIPANAIAQAQVDGGKVVISAISTKLYTYVKDHSSDSIETAMQAVANILGVDKANLLKDFNNAAVSAATRATLKTKADTLLEAIKGKATIAEVKTAADSFVSTLTLPENIDVVRASN